MKSSASKTDPQPGSKLPAPGKLKQVSTRKQGNGNGSGANGELFAVLARLEQGQDLLRAEVATIKDWMATKGDIEDVRGDLEGLSTRVTKVERRLGTVELRIDKIEKSGRKGSNGH